MTRLLTLVGVPQEVMKLVAEVVDTCRICRMWARGAPHVRTAVRISMRFNQTVQGDLMFYSDETGTTIKSYIILHLICECIKWTVAEEITDKETHAILAMMTAWWVRVSNGLRPIPPPCLDCGSEGSRLFAGISW